MALRFVAPPIRQERDTKKEEQLLALQSIAQIATGLSGFAAKKKKTGIEAEDRALKTRNTESLIASRDVEKKRILKDENVPVISQAEALKAKSVLKGTKIIKTTDPKAEAKKLLLQTQRAFASKKLTDLMSIEGGLDKNQLAQAEEFAKISGMQIRKDQSRGFFGGVGKTKIIVTIPDDFDFEGANAGDEELRGLAGSLESTSKDAIRAKFSAGQNVPRGTIPPQGGPQAPQGQIPQQGLPQPPQRGLNQPPQRQIPGQGIRGPLPTSRPAQAPRGPAPQAGGVQDRPFPETPDEVREAFRAGRITRDQAKQILRALGQ